MDNKTLIKNLNKAFSSYSKETGRSYSGVWLTDVNFDGLYENDMFILCVKSDHEIDSCLDEITDILNYLGREAQEESKLIWSIKVYNTNDKIYCDGTMMMISGQEESIC